MKAVLFMMNLNIKIKRIEELLPIPRCTIYRKIRAKKQGKQRINNRVNRTVEDKGQTPPIKEEAILKRVNEITLIPSTVTEGYMLCLEEKALLLTIRRYTECIKN